MHLTHWKALILAALAFGTLNCSGSGSGGGRGYNVVLLTLDTTRADHLGCYGNTDAVTPALDALAANGTVFDRAYAPSPLTLPSHATMLTGLNPNEHGLLVNNKASLATTVPTLATILAESGYDTGAFIAAIVLDSKFGLDRGFATYDDDMTGAIARNSLVNYRPANVVVDSAIEWLGKRSAASQPPETSQRKPFFMWVHLYDPHRPYHEHAELDGTRFAGEKTYEGEIAFMDRHIGRLTAALAGDKGKQRTLVIAVADHGEGLGDHGDPSHGMELYEESLRIPLLVSLPDVIRKGHRSDAVVSLRDLLPTVLDLLGLPGLPESSGRTLATALRGEPLDSQPSYAEAETPYDLYRWSPLHSFTTPAFKYIRSARPELYDRERDPTEMYNLATVYPQRVADLDRDLAAYEGSSLKHAKAGGVKLSEAERRQMEQLGYLIGEGEDDPKPGRDLLNLRDIKDALILRMYDWTIRWALDESAVDPESVATVARELATNSPESPGFHNMLQSALAQLGRTLDEPLPEPDVAKIRTRNEQPDRIVAPFAADFADPAKAAKAQLDAGTALATAGYLDNALGHLFEASRLQPENALVHVYMAQVFRSLKRTERTIAHLVKAIELQPQDAGVQYNLALLYTEAEDYEKAAEHYRKAIAAKPDYADARNNLAYVLTRMDKPREAEELLREALRVNPSLVAAHTNLADLLVQEKRYGEAIAEYDLLMQLNPADKQSAAKLAVLLATCDDEARRDPDRALQLATGAVAATRERSPGALIALARVHAAAGDYAAATTAARKALPPAVFSRRDDLIKEVETELERYTQAARSG